MNVFNKLIIPDTKFKRKNFILFYLLRKKLLQIHTLFIFNV